MFTKFDFNDIIFAKRGSDRKEDLGMRTKLRQLGGQQRYQFTSTFKRTGFKNTYHGQSHPIYQPTLLLVNLWCKGTLNIGNWTII